MVNKLMFAFENQGIGIPNIKSLLDELDAYEVYTSTVGEMVRYSAPSGQHDDIVSSLMLAVSAYAEYSGDYEVRFMEDLPTEKLSIDRLYRDLIEEHEDTLGVEVE